MSLSAKAAKALAEIERNAYLLYGQEYFTEQEWVQLDTILHRGQYVWTRGPAVAASPSVNGEIRDDAASADLGKKTSAVPNVQDPPSVAVVESSRSRSTRARADRRTAQAAESCGKANGGKCQLAPSTTPLKFTQAQLREAKRLSEAHKKSKRSSQKSSQPGSLIHENRFPTERESRTHSWTQNVASQRTVSPSLGARPEPLRKMPSQDEYAILVAEFKRRTGREHRVFTDLWQPNNPRFWANAFLDASPAVPPPKAINSWRSPTTAPGVECGDILVAQRSDVSQSGVLHVLKGDRVEVSKQLGRVTYYGTNERTLKKGTLKLESFQQNGIVVKGKKTKPVVPRSYRAPRPLNSVIARMDSVERRNAKTWEVEDDDGDGEDDRQDAGQDNFIVPKKSAPPATLHRTNLAANTNGNSRFMALADHDRENMNSEAANGTPLTIENVSVASTPLGKAHLNSADEQLCKPIMPKAETCWFWSSGKGCRFTANECRDLHAHTAHSSGSNLYKGKPSWGPLADYLPGGHLRAHAASFDFADSSPNTSDPSFNQSPNQHPSSVTGQSQCSSHPTHESSTVARNVDPAASLQQDASEQHPDALTCAFWAADPQSCPVGEGKCKYVHALTANGVAKYQTTSAPSQSCFYWGTPGLKCKFADGTCRYVHEWSPTGVAYKPHKAGSVDLVQQAQSSGTTRSKSNTPNALGHSWASDVEEEEKEKASTLACGREGISGNGQSLASGDDVGIAAGSSADKPDLDAASDRGAEPSQTIDPSTPSTKVQETEVQQTEVAQTEGENIGSESWGPGPELDPALFERWEGPGGWDLEDLQAAQAGLPVSTETSEAW